MSPFFRKNREHQQTPHSKQDFEDALLKISERGRFTAIMQAMARYRVVVPSFIKPDQLAALREEPDNFRKDTERIEVDMAQQIGEREVLLVLEMHGDWIGASDLAQSIGAAERSKALRCIYDFINFGPGRGGRMVLKNDFVALLQSSERE